MFLKYIKTLYDYIIIKYINLMSVYELKQIKKWSDKLKTFVNCGFYIDGFYLNSFIKIF